MEFPEDFNQLELLNTHGHLIPRGASSLWTGSKDEEDEVEEEEGDHSEEWYLEKEETLKDKPNELTLWAAENNRVSDVLFWQNSDFACVVPLVVSREAIEVTATGSAHYFLVVPPFQSHCLSRSVSAM